MVTAKHLSFSKAATELRIAQSAVSRQIRLLEEALGEQLLVRSSKTVILTAKGLELQHLAVEFDRQCQAIFSEEGLAEIRVGVLHGILESWGVSFLKDFYAKATQNLTVQTGPPEWLLKGLLARRFDILLTNHSIQNDAVSSLKLFDEQMVLISKKPLQLDDVPNQRWICYDENDSLFQAFKRTPSSSHVFCNSMTAIVALVRQGIGIAVVPTHIVGSAEGLFQVKLPKLKNPGIYVSMLNYDVIPKHLKLFIEVLKRKVALETSH